MVEKEQIKLLEDNLRELERAAQLVNLTTRLVSAFVKKVDEEEKKRATAVSGIQLKLFPAVCFAILMENGQGIKAKSPGYVLEKLKACFSNSQPGALLDTENRIKLETWKQTWNKGGE